MSRKFISFWLILVPNIMLLYLSLWLAILLRFKGNPSTVHLGTYVGPFSVIFLLWMIVFFIHGLFEVQSIRRYATLFFNLFSAMAINLLIAITYFYFQPNLILTPRRFLLIVIGVAFTVLFAWYLIVKYILKNRMTEGIYLFSVQDEWPELEQEISENAYLGFRVLGRLQESQLASDSIQKNAGIILPSTLNVGSQILQKFYQLRTLGVRFYNYQDFYENLLRRIYLSELNEAWFLENINYREKRFYILIKRIIDIFFGGIIFLVFLVTYPIIALIIALDSPGPVLFSQKRVGKNGQVFNIYKYRSMKSATDTTWTKVNDPRITKVGKIIRKIRVDELPQSINLLRGELSLVGPRPEQENIVNQLRQQIPFYDERHLVKPGITGWSQLNMYAGSLEETKLKLQYDLYYSKHRSLLFDLEIIFKTMYYIFTWKGR